MASRDKRIDAYIAKSADFAKPILIHLRAVIHTAVPKVEETIKWGMPSYTHHGILCITASFKKHCALVLWPGKYIVGTDAARTRTAMGHFGKITAVKDLPPKRELIGYLKEAAKLNEQGVKVRTTAKTKKTTIPTPADLAAGLKKSARTRTEWTAFSPSARREYVEWITEAKRPETRAERLKTTLSWVKEGKQRNWKYA